LLLGEEEKLSEVDSDDVIEDDDDNAKPSHIKSKKKLKKQTKSKRGAQKKFKKMYEFNFSFINL